MFFTENFHDQNNILGFTKEHDIRVYNIFLNDIKYSLLSSI